MMNTTTVTEFILLGIPFLYELHQIFFVVGLFVYIIAILGNGFILYIVAVEPRLQTPMYIFLSNLAFLEICYTTTVVPKLLQTFVQTRTKICFHCCLAQSFLFFIFGGSELLVLTAMSFDRYLAICKPLQYPMIMTKNVCIQLSLAAWYVSFITLFFQFLVFWQMPFCGPNVVDNFFCESAAMFSLVCTDTHFSEFVGFLFAVLMIVVTLILTIVSYAYIISTVMVIPSAAGRKKAFSTCTSHLIVVFILYGALIAMYVRPSVHSSSRITRVLGVLNTVFIPMLNPFIYTIRNSEVKNAVRNMIHKKRQLLNNDFLNVFKKG
ncbi:olfactory receptor 6X1-like [Eublepharis macularius]|uniref:Olfactory receptor n=1 Tax=Eublepharis macularius TaxID=481883 RepID=A0AA97K5T2_EUBMA|nr:olfactory receptor 6X1-like [Eublepharis macularius]